MCTVIVQRWLSKEWEGDGQVVRRAACDRAMGIVVIFGGSAAFVDSLST